MALNKYEVAAGLAIATLALGCAFFLVVLL